MHQFARFLFPVATIGCALALPEGFEIRKFAGPPDADYPAGITAAANGDVYVSSDQNGSLGHIPKMGRIIRCRDTDGDGKADDFVHFVPDVDSPRGGHFVGDTLFLVHPPFLSTFRDTNGDGVADEKKMLVSGLGGGIEHPRGADHTTNGVRMGIDGWLYISVGDFGTFPAKGTDGSSYALHGGGLLRVRPDGSELEPHAVMTRNVCDTAISPELDMFSRDNTNDGKGWNTRFHHHTALGDHGYPRLYQNFAAETIQPLADYGGGAGTGALWLSEPGFPPEFTDALFSTDWTTGMVHYHPWKRVGASFEVEQKTFEQIPRATDIDVDGHSRLYISDWREGGFEFTPDKKVGMIHQVVFPGLPAAEYQDVAKAGDGALIGLLASASGVQRLEAQQEILKRGAKPEFANGILALAKDGDRTMAVRSAALWTLKQLYGEQSHPKLIELAADETLREQALRALADRRSQPGGVPLKLFTDALSDPNLRVVLQALVGLERLGAKEAAPLIFAASGGWQEEGVSPRLRHTAMQVLASLANVPAGLAAIEDTATRPLALESLQKIHSMEVVDGLLGAFAAASDSDLRFDILGALARLHYKEKEWDLKSWWNTRPDDRGPYYEIAEWEGSGRIRPALEKGFEMVAEERQNELLDILGKNRLPVAELNLAGVDPVLAALATRELNPTHLMLLAQAAKDPSRPFARRVEAYRGLTRGGEEASLPFRLAVLAAWSAEPDVPAEAAQHINDFVNAPERGNQIRPLREIAAREGDEVSRVAWKALITVLRSPLADRRAKQRVEREVARTPREVGFFLAIADLKAEGFEEQIEEGMKWDNSQLIEAAKTAKEAVAASGAGGKKVAGLPVAEVAEAAMEGRGDLAEGERLYTSQGCIACHAVDLKAEQKGPYLGSAGAKFTRDYLIESVLEPNKVVAQGFQTILFKMADGGAKMGFVTAEADGVIELRDIAGQVSRIQRAEVTEESTFPGSMMPPGLAGGLSVEEFTSLIDYMVSLKATGG